MNPKDYLTPMLPEVDYKIFEVSDQPDDLSLTSLEIEVQENFHDLLTELEDILLDHTIVQNPLLVMTHLCMFFGMFCGINIKPENTETLKPLILNLILKQATIAFDSFRKFPFEDNTLSDKKQRKALNDLEEQSPGSIVTQTLHLRIIIFEIIENLLKSSKTQGQSSKDNAQHLCPPEILWGENIFGMIEEQSIKWKPLLGNLPINYAINQFSIQIAWLIGNFCHLHNTPPEKSDYIITANHIIPKLMDSTPEFLKARNKKNKSQDDSIEDAVKDIESLSKKIKAEETPPLDTPSLKDTDTSLNALDKIILDFIMEGIPVKVLSMSLYYFWFEFDSSLRGADVDKIRGTNLAFDQMGTIVEIVRKTVQNLPDPKRSDDMAQHALKMQSLVDMLPPPEELDTVNPSIIAEQNEKVSHKILEFIQQSLMKHTHPVIIANVLFSQWLKFSVFGGVSQEEYQKIDYYLKEVAENVRSHLKDIYRKSPHKRIQ